MRSAISEPHARSRQVVSTTNQLIGLVERQELHHRLGLQLGQLERPLDRLEQRHRQVLRHRQELRHQLERPLGQLELNRRLELLHRQELHHQLGLLRRQEPSHRLQLLAYSSTNTLRPPR